MLVCVGLALALDARRGGTGTTRRSVDGRTPMGSPPRKKEKKPSASLFYTSGARTVRLQRGLPRRQVVERAKKFS